MAFGGLQGAGVPDVYTSSSGFRVVVMEAPEPTLTVYRGMADQYADSGASTSFAVPYDAFVHTDPGARVVLNATQSNGAALPAWVVFNPMTGKFDVSAPPGTRGEVTVKVMARDSQGREISILFRISVGERNASEPGSGNSRASLSEQLRNAGKRVPALASAAPADVAVVQRVL